MQDGVNVPALRRCIPDRDRDTHTHTANSVVHTEEYIKSDYSLSLCQSNRPALRVETDTE